MAMPQDRLTASVPGRSPERDPARRTLLLADAGASEALARTLAPFVRHGDMICLNGALGVGKTTFARALIRALAEDEGLEAPSPSFTLVQTYATPRVTVYHVDLYRLDDFAATVELGIEEMLDDGVVIVEWPDRLGTHLPSARLELAIEETASLRDDRHVTLCGYRRWAGVVGGMAGGDGPAGGQERA